MAVNETSEGQYVVSYKDAKKGVTCVNYYSTERKAVQAIGQIELYENLELIECSDNIDLNKFRR